MVISWVARGPSQSKGKEERGEKRRGKGEKEEAGGGGRARRGRAGQRREQRGGGRGQGREHRCCGSMTAYCSGWWEACCQSAWSEDEKEPNTRQQDRLQGGAGMWGPGGQELK